MTKPIHASGGLRAKIDYGDASRWTQDGAFPDADGTPVRAYDDIVLLSETSSEDDFGSRVPAGTFGTVLFHCGDSTGLLQLEVYPPGVAEVVISYSRPSHVRLQIRNEDKHPREGLTNLYRPVGSKELALIETSGGTRFPPRLAEQPIFYPVTNEAYARQIAKDWNARHNEDRRGFVTRFHVRSDFLAKYERRVVGGREHEEYWIPAEDLEAFSDAIVGQIEVIATYEGSAR